MPQLQDVSASSLFADDPQKQIESVVKQVNQWGRSLSNENRTELYRDNSGTPRILIGVLPDGDTGIVISKPDVDVQDVFD